MKKFFYTYVLRSGKDKKFYTGCTNNLMLRFKQHQDGSVESTSARRPLKLVYYEACLDRRDASHREKYLKRAYGKHFIKSRLKSYLTGSPHQITYSNSVSKKCNVLDFT